MRKWLTSIGLKAAGIFVALTMFITVGIPALSNGAIGTAVQKAVYTIGLAGEAYAVTPDYEVDGTADDVQVQAALNALPVTGGRLIFFAGNYVFAATVSRAINNVTIEGDGKGTYIANDGVTALFSAGAQTGWEVRDLRTDAGGITRAADTKLLNVDLGTTHYGLGGGEILVAGHDADPAIKSRAEYVLDYTSNDATQITAAIARAAGTTDGSVRIVGTCNITSTIDATNYGIAGGNGERLTLYLDDAWFLASTSGTPIIDFTGSHCYTVYGGRLQGLASNSPNIGVLQARNSSNMSAGQAHFWGTDIQGYFTVAAVYNYGSEEDEYFHCFIANYQNDSWAMIIDAANTAGVTSPYQTIASGNQSTTQFELFGTDVYTTVGTGTGGSLKYKGWSSAPAVGLRVYGGEIFSTQTYGVYFDMSGGSIYGFTFDGVRMTDGDPNYCFYAGNASGAVTLGYINITGCIGYADTKEIYTAANITPVRWIVNRSNMWPYTRGFTWTVAAADSDIYGP